MRHMNATKEKVYAFVGIPKYGTMYSDIVDLASIKEGSLDEHLEVMSWTVGAAAPNVSALKVAYPCDECTFVEACRRFAELMERDMGG